MVIVPPSGTPASFGAEKLTELGDISFLELQEYKDGDTRVIAYKPDGRHHFRFVNITHLLNMKPRKGLTQLRSLAKGS